MSSSDRTFPSVWCFSVFAAAEVSVTPRVLGEFAKRDLLPARFAAFVRGGELSIDVEIADLAADVAAHVAEVLRGLVHVERVLMVTRILSNEARA